MAKSPPPQPHKEGGERSAWDKASYGAVILAAGMSSRMGANKLLLPWRDGLPIVAHVAAKFPRAGISPVVVVTGRDAALVEAALAAFDLRCVHNPRYATGEMLSSLQVGLRALPGGLAGAFVQPAHEPGWSLAPSYAGRRGHPVLLDRGNWRAMLALGAGARPRDGLGRVKLVDVADEGVLLDVDTRGVYERLVGRDP